MIVSRDGTHAAPAEIIIASLALHVRTTFVFLNSYFTFRTSANVICQCEANESTFLLIVALTTFVPRLLTLEAGEMIAMCTCNLYLALIATLYIFLTLQVGTPNQVFTHVNFS